MKEPLQFLDDCYDQYLENWSGLLLTFLSPFNFFTLDMPRSNAFLAQVLIVYFHFEFLEGHDHLAQGLDSEVEL